MVSGRKPAALGVRALLAQGRRADLEERRPDRHDREPRKAEIDEAERFAEGIAQRLGVDADYVLPAFEDPAHWLQKEADLPPTSIPPIPNCPTRRSARAWRGSSIAGSNKPMGYVLPIQRWNADAGTRPALEERALEAAARQAVPDPGRFPARPAPAARRPAGYRGRGLSLHRRAGSAGAARRRCRSTMPHGRGRAQRRTAGAEQQTQSGGVRTAMSIETRDGICASSCRRSRGWKIISNWCRDGGDRRRDADAGPCRGLSAAATIRAST